MNKYDVLGVVGEGAYGVVLKCKNKDSELDSLAIRARGRTPMRWWPSKSLRLWQNCFEYFSHLSPICIVGVMWLPTRFKESEEDEVVRKTTLREAGWERSARSK